MLFKSKIVCTSFIYVVMFKSCAVYQKIAAYLDDWLQKEKCYQNWWTNKTQQMDRFQY
jgi:hypothetical protein